MPSPRSFVFFSCLAVCLVSTVETVEGVTSHSFTSLAESHLQNFTANGYALNVLETVLLTAPSKLQSRRYLNRTNDYDDPAAARVAASCITMALYLPNSPTQVESWLRNTTQQLQWMVGEHGYPALRRVVTASVVRIWMHLESENLWGPRLDAAALDTLFQLFQLHRAGAMQKVTVEFLHISKAGGTSICALAGDSGCVSPGYMSLLKPPFDDHPRWARKARVVNLLKKDGDGFRTWAKHGPRDKTSLTNQSCTARSDSMITHSRNFYANEYCLLGGQASAVMVTLCREFLHVILLREPYARIVSHIKYMAPSFLAVANSTAAYFAAFSTAASWQTVAPAPMDNYYIRSLLGEHVFNLPVSKIEPEHLQQAQLVLLHFDVVLVLEDTPYSSSLGFRYGLGWPHTLSEEHKRDANETHAEVGTERISLMDLVPKDVASLRKPNELDQDLYHFGMFLSKLDAMVFEVAEMRKQPTPPQYMRPAVNETANGTSGAIPQHCGWVGWQGSDTALAA